MFNFDCLYSMFLYFVLYVSKCWGICTVQRMRKETVKNAVRSALDRDFIMLAVQCYAMQIVTIIIIIHLFFRHLFHLVWQPLFARPAPPSVNSRPLIGPSSRLFPPSPPLFHTPSTAALTAALERLQGLSPVNICSPMGTHECVFCIE